MEATEKKKTKPKYNMWQNTWYMVQTAWEIHKPVIFLCIALAVVSAAGTVAEMLITPIILGKVESAAAAGELIATIAAYIGALLLLRAAQAYIKNNTIFGRIETRTTIINRISLKVATTSYPNTLDTRFIEQMNNAYRTVSNNDAAAEAIWRTWTNILTNVIGFAVYILLLLELDAWLVLLVAATAAVSYLASKHINEWGYRHRKERMEYNEKLTYIRDVATGRSYAKDIRMFGLANWIEELYAKTLNMLHAFVIRREKAELWGNVIDIALTFLRNGAAYAYLIWYTLEHGLGAAQFLLYFGAVSGFTQWVTGILDQFSTLHKQSLDLSELREYLEWEEPFNLESGERIDKRSDMPCEIKLENVRYRYPGAEKDTIKGLDLTIHAGEKLAIVGLNGAGKTTVFNCITQFYKPTGGLIYYRNREDKVIVLNKYQVHDVIKTGIVRTFQNVEVIYELSILDNLLIAAHTQYKSNIFAQMFNTKGVKQEEAVNRKKALKVLEYCGLLDKKDLPPVGLPYGVLKRIELARTLMAGASLIILDEPAAGLNDNETIELAQMIRRIRDEFNVTIFLVEHDMGLVMDICEHICAISFGKKLAYGTPQEIQENPVVQEAYLGTNEVKKEAQNG